MLGKRAILQSYGLHTTTEPAQPPLRLSTSSSRHKAATQWHCTTCPLQWHQPKQHFCQALLARVCNPPVTMVCTPQMTEAAQQPLRRSTSYWRQNAATQCCSTTCHATTMAPTQTFIASRSDAQAIISTAIPGTQDIAVQRY